MALMTFIHINERGVKDTERQRQEVVKISFTMYDVRNWNFLSMFKSSIKCKFKDGIWLSKFPNKQKIKSYNTTCIFSRYSFEN